MTAVPSSALGEDDRSLLHAGLAQRVRALEVVVADAAGARRAVAEGVLPGAAMVRARGYSRQAHGTPLPGTVVPLAAFDLDRDAGGRWRVVGSHVGGAAAWPVHHRADADLADLVALADPLEGAGQGGTAPRPPHPPAPRRRTSVAAALAACAPGTAVLLAPAPPEGEVDPWEATALAHGLPLVRGSDLVVSAGRLLVRTTSGRSPVAVVLRALADDELDPVVSEAPGAARGCPGLLTAVRAGGVALVPALGAGLADDEAVRRATPDLVRWALGEEPLLGEAAHPEGPPLLRLVTISDGVDLDVVPGLLAPGGGGAGSPVARLWRGGERPALLVPPGPAAPRRRATGSAPPAPPSPAVPVPVPAPGRAATSPRALDLRAGERALVGEPC